MISDTETHAKTPSLRGATGLIELEEMEFYSYHGHFKEEQIVGNKFTVNITIETDCTKAAETDDLEDALNYVSIYNITKEEMDKKSHLLEHLTARIIDRIRSEFPQIISCRVKVSKLNPPVGGRMQKVSVTLTR